MRVQCRKCRAIYDVSESMDGKTAPCEKCHKPIRYTRVQATVPNTGTTHAAAGEGLAEDPNKSVAEPVQGIHISELLTTQEYSTTAPKDDSAKLRYWFLNSLPVAIVCVVMGCGLLYLAYASARELASLPTEDWDVAAESAQRRARHLAKQNPGQVVTVVYTPSPVIGEFVEMFGFLGVCFAGFSGLACLALGYAIIFQTYDEKGTDLPFDTVPLSERSETYF